MTDKIILTFGSPDNLKKLIAGNPDRQFAYLEEVKHEDKFALFDLSGKESIFDYGITLRPFKEVGNIEFRGLIRYESFRLGKHDKELFRKKAAEVLEKSQKDGMIGGLLCTRDDVKQRTILITIWIDRDKMNTWRDGADYSEIVEFADRSARNDHFTEVYRLADD
ncbi:hypothetical protein [uncultured Limosilactobacillus sp.]|uniref:hypothetical protein n=1 Tax=uncultured Limosilactobacillus sp. TaxID=2837629 RepID=UPI0026005A9D|nr:hypothetical protein [uncultured Limosilactobacillus sp.]